MNVTFLIGNGFDLNLGLKTSYKDFIKFYKQTEGKTNILRKFRKDIQDEEELWSNAEIALGKYTEFFGEGDGRAFSECQQDMCEYIACYLKSQEAKLNLEDFAENILSSFKNITTPENPFPAQERNIIRDLFNTYRNKNFHFNFICFNYTSTLDKCLNIVKSSAKILGNHRNGNILHSHLISDLCYVHGTLEKNMVFGVNDETQIAKPDIFKFKNGKICKQFLIKKQANDSYQENTDNIAHAILQKSNIIYIYGMSLGQTDKLWWDRICDWIKDDSKRHLIIHNHTMPQKGAFPLDYTIAENEKKEDVLSFCDFNDEVKTTLLDQIHITNHNIFEKIKGIANENLTITKEEEKI